MGSGGTRHSGQPLLRYGESVSMNTVWIGACASLAMSVTPGRNALSGGVTVRVTNAPGVQEQLAAVARFGEFFLGGLFELYWKPSPDLEA